MAEKKRFTREKNESNTTESGLVSRSPKIAHKRKSKTYLCEWRTSDNQLNNEKGIEEYKRLHNLDLSGCCSKVYIVAPTGADAPGIQETFTKFQPEKALVNKSEYDKTEPNSSVFSRDSIARYLYDIQSKTSIGETDKKNTESRKNSRHGSVQQRVFRQTYRFPPVVAVRTLESDTVLPQEESFVSQFSVSPQKPKLRSGEKHPPPNCHVIDNHCSHITFSPSNSVDQVTCPSHVYTFNRGLIPSREAHSLELCHTEHFLPPVVADRVGNVSERKHYRLSLEKDKKSSNNAKCLVKALYSYSPEEKILKKNCESKSVVYKEFSAETIIPASYGKRYFDFQGYIEFLCKERNLRKNSAMISKQLDVCNLEKLQSSWLNNLSKVLVKDAYDYSKMLDIKGSRMKLDENPVQMRLQAKPLSEPHQHCCLGNANNLYIKTQRKESVPVPRKRKSKQKTVLIERLPSNFQFTLPGRPPSSDDSGFAE